LKFEKGQFIVGGKSEMETAKSKEAPKILIVDDIDMNVRILENIMRGEGYEPLCALSVPEALDIMKETMPQLILSDFSMPGMDGLEFCKLLKSSPRTRNIPFIFITVADTREEKKAAFSAGAVDFIPKPFEAVEVIMRVRNQLSSYQIKQQMEHYNRMMHTMVSEQKKQMEKERESILLALAKIVERRNIYTGDHLERTGCNCRLLAQSLQLVQPYENEITDEFIETIEAAVKLHDIGNIIMSDEVIFQQYSTDEDGWAAVRQHAEEGAKILAEINEGNKSPFLDMAILIARYHHAHWDGSGYPTDAVGNDIPLAARIAALAIDFDVLAGTQTGREGYSVDKSVRIINDKSGTVYDPHIVEVFNKVTKQLRID